jgi:hypothetical protein
MLFGSFLPPPPAPSLSPLPQLGVLRRPLKPESEHSLESRIEALGAEGGHHLGLELALPRLSQSACPHPLPGTEAKKSGVCPELQADPNCTKECVSDSDCADTRKCCQAGCSTLCSVPNGNPAATWREPGGPRGLERRECPGSGKKGAPRIRDLGKI